MSDRQQADTNIVIHERALNSLGLKISLILLSVARDLRSGVIENDQYNQRTFGNWDGCNTACCIWGHACSRMGITNWKERRTSANKLISNDKALSNLFAAIPIASMRRMYPEQAAEAIENYVLKGHDRPWDAVKNN